jgi:hypothetical protein
MILKLPGCWPMVTCLVPPGVISQRRPRKLISAAFRSIRVWWGGMQVEEFRRRCGAPAGASSGDAFFDRLVGREPGASGDVVVVVPVDLSGGQLVRRRPGGDRLQGEQGGTAFLPEAELALGLAFGPGIFGDEAADAQTAVGEEDIPHMSEVGEGGFGLDETGPDHETGGVVDGEGEALKLVTGPPWVRRAVMLEEIRVALALPPAVGCYESEEGAPLSVRFFNDLLSTLSKTSANPRHVSGAGRNHAASEPRGISGSFSLRGESRGIRLNHPDIGSTGVKPRSSLWHDRAGM